MFYLAPQMAVQESSKFPRKPARCRLLERDLCYVTSKTKQLIGWIASHIVSAEAGSTAWGNDWPSQLLLILLIHSQLADATGLFAKCDGFLPTGWLAG